MRKIIIQCGFFAVLAVSGVIGIANSAEAAPGKWSKFMNWLNSPVPQPEIKTSQVPESSSEKVVVSQEIVAPQIEAAQEKKADIHTILSENGAELEKISPPSPMIPAKIIAPESVAKPQIISLTANTAKPVIKPTVNQKSTPLQDPAVKLVPGLDPVSRDNTSTPAPQWNLKSLPVVKIGQKNYADINLNEYIVPNSEQESFLFSLTPIKANPSWASLKKHNWLHIAADKISPEDIHTTQIIYLTVTNPRNGQFSSTQLTIQIMANDSLPAPTWQPNFHFQDAIAGQPYNINLAAAVKLNDLPENDQLTFQLINNSVEWLNIGQDGFSLSAKKIPATAIGKTYPVALQVTSKMSGKSSDYSGQLYVNPSPQPFQWQSLPAATLNQKYTVDLSQYVRSNIRNDQFSFHIDLVTLPYWLSIQNTRILSGSPLETSILDHEQKINVITKSLVTGMTSETSVIIPVNRDEKLAAEWKKEFFTSPIVGENYRSDDLATGIGNHYQHDEFTFTYVNGPEWLTLNRLCHCLVSKGTVPNEAAGKTFTVQLRVLSKASNKTTDYTQSFMVYRGVPQWIKTTLPDVKIAQNNTLRIPLSEYVQDDIGGDHFSYRMDQFRSPSWVRFIKEGNQFFLKIQPEGILASEVGSTQTVRLLATSQHTHKTSEQLLTIRIQTNPELVQPTWQNPNPAVATVGFQHVMDLKQYIQTSVPNDKIKISLGAGSPDWLSIKDNRLLGTPPKDQIGGPYPLNLVIHSQATGKENIIQTKIKVELAVVEGDNMEVHSFYENHQSIVIRGLKKNHSYHLSKVKGANFDYGPFYSPYMIKSDEDWNNNPFYSVSGDKIVKTGEDGVLSIVYYSAPNSPPPSFEFLILS